MSTTATKRTLAEARRDANEVGALFRVDSYEEWVIAGSVRRGVRQVGDVEHVVRPKIGAIPGNGLFGEPGNLVFARLDELVAAGTVTKHIYGASGFRWGEKCRGFDYRGHMHEIYCATLDNWGATLAIRTGPKEFSQRLVRGLLRNGRRNDKGKVWRCEPCTWCNIAQDPRTPLKVCLKCDGTGLLPVEQIPVPDERVYFELCGVAWTEPEDRR